MVSPAGLGPADDLVVDVGDVHDPGHAQAHVAQVADEQVGEQERPEVPDVGRAVDRRAAGVDPDVAGLERHERPGLAGERVVEADGHELGTSPLNDACPQPVSPDRDGRGRRDHPSGTGRALEVAGRGLDADRRDRQSKERRDRLAHRLQVAAKPRPGAGDRQVDRGRAPAGRSDAIGNVGEHGPAADPARRPRVGREEAPEVAQRRRPEQRVGDGVEDHVAVRMSVQPRRARDLDAPKVERLAGPERMAVVTLPVRCSRRAANSASARARSPGRVTLRFTGSPGTGWTRIVQAIKEGGLVREPLRAIGRIAMERVAQQAGPGALGCLGGGQPIAFDDLETEPSPASASEGVGHGDHRHGRAMGVGNLGHRRYERRRNEGRAPSWTRTTRSAAAASPSSAPSAARPAATEAPRCSPPGTIASTASGRSSRTCSRAGPAP